VDELIILWDIDGTLIDTRGAGVDPLVAGIKQVLSMDVKLDRRKMAGYSDYEIIEQLTNLRTSKASNEILFEKILDYYATNLFKKLRENPVKLLGESVIALKKLSQTKGVRIGILTGNCEIGGKTKLESGNIYKYIDRDLFFYSSFYHSSRSKVLKLAKSIYKNIVIVGDTPNDVEAGRQFAIPVISTPTGAYNESELREINHPFVLSENWNYKQLIQMLTLIDAEGDFPRADYPADRLWLP